MPDYIESSRMLVLSSLHSVTLRAFGVIARCWSSTWTILRRIACHFPRPFFISLFLPSKGEFNSNIPGNPISATSQQLDCMTYTMRLQPQHDLEMIGVGSTGQVYEIDDQIVLKSCRVSNVQQAMPLRGIDGSMLLRRSFTAV